MDAWEDTKHQSLSECVIYSVSDPDRADQIYSYINQCLSSIKAEFYINSKFYKNSKVFDQKNLSFSK